MIRDADLEAGATAHLYRAAFDQRRLRTRSGAVEVKAVPAPHVLRRYGCSRTHTRVPASSDNPRIGDRLDGRSPHIVETNPGDFMTAAMHEHHMALELRVARVLRRRSNLHISREVTEVKDRCRKSSRIRTCRQYARMPDGTIDCNPD